MRLLVVISIALVWCLGLIQPGIWTHSFNLHKMYEQCSHEDPDIDPLDFVVEHLLNLEDILDYIEGEDDGYEEGEIPHQPYQHTQLSTHSFVALPKTVIGIAISSPALNLITHSTFKNDFYHYNFHADIFRPPAIG